MLEDLRPFKLDGLQPFYADSNAGRNVGIQLDDDDLHLVRTPERSFLEMLHVSNAAKQMSRLPHPGESIHCIMRGNYNAWDIVPAVLSLAAPSTIEQLYIATLGFNRRNAEELIQLVNRGSVASVGFICSAYYRSMEPDVFEQLHGFLIARGHRATAIRSHAKILLFKMSTAEHYAVESSANLRSCRNIEQFCLSQDAALFDFHRAWMDRVLASPAEPSPRARTRKLTDGHSQKRAGVGVFSVKRSEDDRRDILSWKKNSREHKPTTARFAQSLAELIRRWSPQLPRDTLITCPPQGASAPGFYFAAALADSTAKILDRCFALTLERDQPKRYHHPKQSLAQGTFRVSRRVPATVLVIDDLITSGTTMRLSLDALRARGTMTFGFAYAGC